jgi:hypothetical protein
LGFGAFLDGEFKNAIQKNHEIVRPKQFQIRVGKSKWQILGSVVLRGTAANDNVFQAK